jgi:hypothetical protein
MISTHPRAAELRFSGQAPVRVSTDAPTVLIKRAAEKLDLHADLVADNKNEEIHGVSPGSTRPALSTPTIRVRSITFGHADSVVLARVLPFHLFLNSLSVIRKNSRAPSRSGCSAVLQHSSFLSCYRLSFMCYKERGRGAGILWVHKQSF